MPRKKTAEPVTAPVTLEVPPQPMGDYKCYLNRAFLRALSVVASKDETRFSLIGINVTVNRKHTTYVATDGRILMAIRELYPLDDWPHSVPEFSFTFPTSAVKYLAAGKKWVLPNFEAIYNASTHRIEFEGTNGVGFSVESVTGEFKGRGEVRYPNWRTVTDVKLKANPGDVQHWPAADRASQQLTINAAFLGRLESAAAIAAGRKSAGAAVLMQGNNTWPILVQWSDIKDFELFAILMPMRVADDDRRRDSFKYGFIPDWAKPPKSPAAETPTT